MMTIITMLSVAAMIVLACLGFSVNWGYLILLPFAIAADVAMVVAGNSVVKAWKRFPVWRSIWRSRRILRRFARDGKESARMMNYALTRIDGQDVVTVNYGPKIEPPKAFTRLPLIAKWKEARRAKKAAAAAPPLPTTEDLRREIASLAKRLEKLHARQHTDIDAINARFDDLFYKLDAEIEGYFSVLRTQTLDRDKQIAGRVDRIDSSIVRRLDTIERQNVATLEYMAGVVHSGIEKMTDRVDVMGRRIEPIAKIGDRIWQIDNRQKESIEMDGRRHGIVISHLQSIQERFGPEIAEIKLETRALTIDDIRQQVLNPETIAKTLEESRQIEEQRRRNAEAMEAREKERATVSPAAIAVAQVELQARRKDSIHPNRMVP